MRSDVFYQPTVAVALDPGTFQPDQTQYLQFDRFNYRLLIHSYGQYFIYRPVRSKEDVLQMLIIPDSRIRRIRVQEGVIAEQ
jgi:hypothetical protein